MIYRAVHFIVTHLVQRRVSYESKLEEKKSSNGVSRHRDFRYDPNSH